MIQNTNTGILKIEVSETLVKKILLRNNSITRNPVDNNEINKSIDDGLHFLIEINNRTVNSLMELIHDL